MSSPEQYFLSAIGYFKHSDPSWMLQVLFQTQAGSADIHGKAEHLSAQKNELWLRLSLWHTCPKDLWSFSMGILVAWLLTVIAVPEE